MPIINLVGFGSGEELPDGNNIEYPIDTVPAGDKAYLEDSIQEISLAIQLQASSGTKYKVAEMADAIRSLYNGLHATQLVVYSADVENIGPLENN